MKTKMKISEQDMAIIASKFEQQEIGKKWFVKIMGKDKFSRTKWSQSENQFTWDEIKKQNCNVGFLPPKNYLILDCDDGTSIKLVEKVLKTVKVRNDICWDTPHGRHYLFKFNPAHDPVMLPTSRIGEKYNGFHMKMDYKGYKAGTVRLTDRIDPKIVNKWMENTSSIPELPIVLYPFDSKHIDFNDFQKGFRHEVMFNKWIPNLRRVFSNDTDVLEKLLKQLIMDYYGDNNPSDKVDKWIEQNIASSKDMGEIRPMTYERLGELTPYFSRPPRKKKDEPEKIILTGVKDYVEIYKYLIEKFKLIRTVDYKMWSWDKKTQVYLENENWQSLIKHELSREAPNIKTSLLSDVTNGLEHYVEITPDRDTKDLINFKNGCLNIHTMNFAKGLRFSKNIIPWNYKPTLDEKHLEGIDVLFDNWATDKKGELNKDIKIQLLEMIGYAMCQSTKFDAAFFLIGKGSNGKSKFLNLLEMILGKHNVSNEDIKVVSDNIFASAELHNKLANINGDISSSRIADPSHFKRIISGDTISAQHKHKNAFTFSPYATLIFGANNVPYGANEGDSKAMERRINLIPFDNEFQKGSEAFNNFGKQWEQITTVESIENIITMAVNAIAEAFKRGKLTESDITKRKMEQYKANTNPVQSYIFEYMILEKVGSFDVNILFDEYKVWCDRNKYKARNMSSFTKMFEKTFRDNDIEIKNEVKTKEGKRINLWILPSKK